MWWGATGTRGPCGWRRELSTLTAGPSCRRVCRCTASALCSGSVYCSALFPSSSTPPLPGCCLRTLGQLCCFCCWALVRAPADPRGWMSYNSGNNVRRRAGHGSAGGSSSGGNTGSSSGGGGGAAFSSGAGGGLLQFQSSKAPQSHARECEQQIVEVCVSVCLCAFACGSYLLVPSCGRGVGTAAGDGRTFWGTIGWWVRCPSGCARHR